MTTWKVKRDHGWWIAQCIEEDLCTQAKTLDDILEEVTRFITAHVEANREQGLSPWKLPTPPSVVDEFSDASVTFHISVAP